MKSNIDNIAEDAAKGNPDALNAMPGELEAFSKEKLVGIFQKSPHTLSVIALAAAKGNPSALNAISEQLKAFSKEELVGIFKSSPHTLSNIAFAAAKGNPDALNAISEQLKAFSKEELVGIFTISPDTLSVIAFAAAKGNPSALNAISEQLKAFSKEELVGIFKSSTHHTLGNITFAAAKGNPDALNAISKQLKAFSKEELVGIFQNSPHTLNRIAFAACNQGDPDALNAISKQLKAFSKKELVGIFKNSPDTLDRIALAAAKGNPSALNAISEQLKAFSKEELVGIFTISPDTLSVIAFAAAKGNPSALNALSEQLKAFSKEELVGIFKSCPHALSNIAFAAAKGNPDALNAISEQLKAFSKEELVGIFKSSPHTLGNITFAAAKGNPDALNAISEVFLDNSSDFSNLIKCNEEILELIFSEEFFKKIRSANFEKLITKIQDTDISNLTPDQSDILRLYKQKVAILMSQFKGGFRYRSNIAEAKIFLNEFNDKYKELRKIYPNLLIDHLISQWNEYSDLETPDKDINSEIKELISLLSQQEVGYHAPNGNLKIRDLANHLDLQINQNNYLNPEHIFLKEPSFRLYCESFIKFCKKSDAICNILSIGDQDSVIKEHLYLIFSNGENSPNMQEMKTLVDDIYEDSVGSCIKRGDMSVETLLGIVRSCQSNISHECGSNKRSCSTAFMSSSSYSGQDLNGSGLQRRNVKQKKHKKVSFNL